MLRVHLRPGRGKRRCASGGISPDQRYWLHAPSPHQTPTEQAFPLGNYMRVPSGQAIRDCTPEPKAKFELADPEREFERVGCGALGTDLQAEGRYVSAGGDARDLHLQRASGREAPPKGNEAIYDREAGSAATEVVSIKPDGSPFGRAKRPGTSPATEDGAAVVFSIAGALYLRQPARPVGKRPSPRHRAPTPASPRTASGSSSWTRPFAPTPATPLPRRALRLRHR